MTEQAHFSKSRASVPAARKFVDDVLAREGIVPVIRARAQLVVSELATNSITHARTGFTLRIVTGRDRVRLEVTDNGDGNPVPRNAGPTQSSGRGLKVVEAMADGWGVEPGAGGKTVWAILPRDPDTADGHSGAPAKGPRGRPRVH